MPHDLLAEQSVLGAMFMSKTAIQKAVETLTRESFYIEKNGTIFDVIKELADAAKPIDIAIVISELEKKKQLGLVGGIEYITELTTIVPSAANVEEYIKIVEEKAIRRRLIEAAFSIEKDGYNWDESLDELLDKSEKNLMNISKSRSGSEFRKIADVLYKTQLDLEKLSQLKGEITGLTTGFYDLDKVTSGLHENELIIIAARPGMGKTAFALNLLVNATKNTGDRKSVV